MLAFLPDETVQEQYEMRKIIKGRSLTQEVVDEEETEKAKIEYVVCDEEGEKGSLLEP